MNPIQSTSIKELSNEIIENITNERPNKNVIPTGFKYFDEEFGGLSLGELVVIGGRPAMGKSLFVVNLVSNIGFGPKATHTKSWRSKVINRRTYSLQLPLSHPDAVAPDKDYHKEILKEFSRVRPLQKLKYQIKARLRPYKHYLLSWLNVGAGRATKS